MRETKDDTNRWRDISYSWIRGINTVKMTILPKATYRFNAILIKLPMAFFTNTNKKYVHLVWKHKRSPYQSNFDKVKQNMRNQSPLLLRLYYKATVIKLAWYWHKNRNIDQLKMFLESPEMNPLTYSQIIYHRGGKTIQWRKDNFFNKWFWNNWTPAC